jgi:hypothetical protein
MLDRLIRVSKPGIPGWSDIYPNERIYVDDYLACDRLRRVDGYRLVFM